MHAVRSAYLTLVATFVVAAAGCGGSNVAATDSGPSPAAELKPGALVYVETVSDPGSEQWQQAEDLVRRFPDGEKWLDSLRKMIAGQGANWEQDIEPALGETTAVAVYPTGEEVPDTVVLTNPEDPDKTIALFEKLDEHEGSDATVTRVVGDWVVMSGRQPTIDAALTSAGGDSLADDESFKAAMAEVPDDALTRFYADPAGAFDVTGSGDRAAARLFDRLAFAGAWVKARENGADLALSVGGEGAAGLLAAGKPYSSALLERVPDDALAFISFQGPAAKRQLEALKDNPTYSMGLRRFEREVGVKLEDLLTLADGEVAFYGRLALPFPELTLLLESDNPAQTRASAEKLLRAFAHREGGEVIEDGDVTTAVVEGFSVNLGLLEGLVVFTTSKDAFDELAATGDKLPDTDRFKDALETAGVPDKHTGLAYVDLAEVIGLVQAYLTFTDSPKQLPPAVARNLEPLRLLVAWGSSDSRDGASARAFLGID
jgi:Protein of unknown function (DUF3352)